MEKLTLKLGHLYPELMDIHGDSGNILTLKRRCEWRNIDLVIQEINIGDDVENCDIYFLGSGQSMDHLITVAEELQKNKDFLKSEVNANKVFLAICGGYQIFGNYIQLGDKKINGIGLLDAYSVIEEDRLVGNVSSKLINVDLTRSTLVGFENHKGKTFLNAETVPLAELIIGKGNNDKDKSEGARFKNVFGTYLHGPLLPKNPDFADYLITLALDNKYQKEFELEELDDTFENQAHNSVLNKAY